MSKDDGAIDMGHMIEALPSDEYLHEPSGSPFFNESAWFSFAIPDRSIGGWFYVSHRPNLNLSIAGVALFDPTGSNSYDCLYYDWGDLQPFNRDSQMYDFDMANGVSMRCVEPLKTYKLSYTSDQCRIQLDWTALYPAHATTYPKGGEQWGKSHFDQIGIARGTVEIGGETLPVDHIGLRDRSWGNRAPHTTPRGGYPWCFPDQDTGFFFKAVSDVPPAQDPIHGTTERGIWGFYLQDGVLQPLAHATRRCLERDSTGRPTLIQAVGTDVAGRRFTALGEPVSHLDFHGQAFMYHNWMLTRWNLNGVTGYGEESDFYPIQQGRRLLRSNRTQPGLARAGD